MRSPKSPRSRSPRLPRSPRKKRGFFGSIVHGITSIFSRRKSRRSPVKRRMSPRLRQPGIHSAPQLMNPTTGQLYQTIRGPPIYGGMPLK